jgi:hypothetical protein
VWGWGEVSLQFGWGVEQIQDLSKGQRDWSLVERDGE